MLYTEIWTFQLGPSVKLRDLDGFEVEATDGSIGKVDRATDEAANSPGASKRGGKKAAAKRKKKS